MTRSTDARRLALDLGVASAQDATDPPRHLFQERQIRSVTANTRQDAREFLAFAAAHPLSVTTMPYALGEADRALEDLAAGRVTGAAVLLP